MLKIGICGAGFMGGMHAACYDALPNAKVTAVADVRKENAEKLAGPRGAKVFATAKELIAQADVDVVDICLPTHLHAENAVLAAKRGVSCLCEKPLARTVAQADAIVRAVEKAGIACMVGQVIRFWPEYVVLKDYYDKKRLGRLLALSLARVSPRPTWAWKDWLNQGDLSGGAILDLHIHDADFVRHLLGDPRGFHSVGTFGRKGYDYVFTNYVYPGVAVSAEGGWNMPSGFPFEMSFRAVFEQGTIFYSSRHTPMTLYRADGKNVPVKVPQPQVKGGGAGGNISSLGGYFNEIQYFVNCVSRGKKPEMATVQDARDSVALALAEIRSAERNTGRR